MDGSGQGSIQWRRLWVGVGKGVYVNGDGYGWVGGGKETVIYVNGDGYEVGVGKGLYVNGDGYGWEWGQEYT